MNFSAGVLRFLRRSRHMRGLWCRLEASGRPDATAYWYRRYREVDLDEYLVAASVADLAGYRA
jgi:hypothetical protein